MVINYLTDKTNKENILIKEWQNQAVALSNTQVMSVTDIAKQLGIARTTVRDHLNRHYAALSVDKADEMFPQTMPLTEDVEEFVPEEVVLSYETVFKIVTDQTKQEGTHLFIADCQVKPNISLDYLTWLGKFIVRKQPDVIINISDFADMESLSSYDRGKKSAEGKRVQQDINAAIEGMEALLQPLYDLQQQQLEEYGEILYKPRMVLTLGNHEDRITRYVNNTPELEGFLSIDDLKYKEFGWEVYDFLTPVKIGGISYCHYFQNVMTGKPLSGTAANMLKTLGGSFSMGHRQQLDVATRFLQIDGSQQWGLICGAYYDHDEAYKGVQGNKHWRGVVVKHNVKNGSYDPLFVSIDWLREQYGRK